MTLDDDVVLTRTTIRNLVVELMKNPTVGATCSQCGVLNKDTNLLTRLQGLEYAGFNATRLADQGFFGGPLVMHGMLTAFRAHALKEVRGFTEKHLIEDYEITTRLKEAGWRVKSAAHAYALTQVPETLAELWRQRTRWSYGGMMVMAHARSTGPVIQDVLGHAVFVATILLIDIMIFSPKGTMVPEIGKALMAIALLQLSLWYGFQLWLMRFYRERDRLDWVIRLSLIPEFIYSNILTLVLVGSYLFFAFNLLASRVTDTSGTILWWMVRKTRGVFLDFGYTEGWGTRTQS